jgi:hypothetical protein
MVAQSVVTGAVQASNKPPFYSTGLKMMSAFVAFMIPLAAFGIFYVKWQNGKKLHALAINSPETRELRLKTFEELGSDHPDFLYEI